MREYIVTKEREAETKCPIQLTKGERVKCGEISDDNGDWAGWIYCTGDDKEGWVPRNIIEIDAAEGFDEGIILEDYDATEFDLIIGDRIAAEKTLNGWVYGYKNGDSTVKAWAPLNHLNDVTNKLKDLKKGNQFIQRPGLLTAIAILNIVSSLNVFYQQVQAYKNQGFQVVTSDPRQVILFAIANVILISAFASSIAILSKKLWGWILIVFNYTFSISRLVVASGYVLFNFNEIPSQMLGITIFGLVIKLVVQGLILFYLFGNRVMEYFDLDSDKKKYILIRALACAIITLLLIEVLSL